MNLPGSYLFRVGPLKDPNDNIEEPDVAVSAEEQGGVQTCSNKGRLKCHSNAFCQDAAQGFCCICKNGYYGNGYNCIKNDVPIRVSGKISGKLGDLDVNSQIQSYVVMADGRTYTAVSPLESDVSSKLQLLPILGGVIGWLFAKPMSTNLNGYQVSFKTNFLLK
jgi:nidogen (entactin)